MAGREARTAGHAGDESASRTASRQPFGYGPTLGAFGLPSRMTTFASIRSCASVHAYSSVEGSFIMQTTAVV